MQRGLENVSSSRAQGELDVGGLQQSLPCPTWSNPVIMNVTILRIEACNKAAQRTQPLTTELGRKLGIAETRQHVWSGGGKTKGLEPR